MFTLEGEDTCVGGVGIFVRVFMSHAFCCAGNDGFSAVVDIFNVTAGTRSTAKLSHAATFLSATSLPNVGVAIFAASGCAGIDCFSAVVDIFNVTAGTWSTANLSQARAARLAATSLPTLGIAMFAGGQGMWCDDFAIVERGWGGEENLCLRESRCIRVKSEPC